MLSKCNMLAIASTFLFACAGDKNSNDSPSGVVAGPTSSFITSQASIPAVVGHALTSQSVTWSVQEGTSGGLMTSGGLYTAPASSGTYHVVATSVADNTKSATATATVAAATVATPTFSPAPGAVAQGTVVTVRTTTSGASIYLGQTNPPTSLGSTFTVTSAGTWYAQATESGMASSAVASASYTILASGTTVATPTFSPPPGAVTAGTVVTVSSTTPGATILWGTTNPPAVQRSTFTVSVPGTWYAQGTASGLTSSSVASAAYTISGTSPWLYVGPSSNPSKVTGPRILLNGVNYLGRGVNLNDIRNCGSCVNSSEASSLSVAESLMDAAVTTFGSNFIRLVTMCYTNGSYSENYACAGSDPTYLEDMVTLIQRAATHYSTPVYVMLSIWDDPTLSSEDWPTAATNTEWQVWVNALLTQPNVMFGLTNEPNGQGSSSDDAGAWSALNTAATTIRAVEDAAGTPHHIISSQGVDGYSRNVNYYVTHPITADGGGNIVYGIHAYDAASAFTTCTNSPYCWGEWEPQSLSIPVIIEEFGIASGYMTASDATTLMKDAQDLDVPYTAWDFNNNCAPDLINGSGCSASGITPTTWGTQVQTQLATPWSP